MLYLLFFGSGASALVYEVVWVRVFANVFGNTIYSASIVTAVFMLGLGIGSYVAGVRVDRRYDRSRGLIHVFASLEGAIGILGLAISMLLPHLGDLSAAVSSYTRGADGWYVLSFGSYAARTLIAVALLTPITMLMGATLAVLIRHVVRGDPTISSWRIALLYGVNTLGAAIGCFLTDFSLVPSFGLHATQTVAVAVNLATAMGALAVKSQVPNPKPRIPMGRLKPAPTRIPDPGSRIPVASAAATILLTGAAGMGMEIVWFRHFSILLGEFRAVFALLLAIVLLGMGAGSLVGAHVQQRIDRPARFLLVVQAIFVVTTLLGLAAANARSIDDIAAQHPTPNAIAEFWFNARPILLVVGIPALLMGCAYPAANAIIQRTEATVGRRAGLLYLANTFGAVCGSLITGFILLPRLGMQRSAAVLMMAAAAAALPIGGRKALAIPAVAIGGWLLLPTDYLLSRALLFPPQRAYTVSEGVTELVAVTDGPDGGRVLVTNGHPMSSTELQSQRYMRAMAHIPLLAIDTPERVLVLCFGVGNTANAATLHPSVKRVEIVDLSRHILEHADYFKAFNGDVLRDPRVAVYVNDGRHHLQMQPPHSYDLITLEPPPIVHAGVAALYTTEFYERARARLKPNGYLTQWLPAFGVPQSMILSMARSFVDVFPDAVLLSGASSNLLLVGTPASNTVIDPKRLADALANAPAVQMDLQRLDLGTPREIVGTFVASAKTLASATRGVAPVTDDRPVQEYARKSLLEVNEGIPSSLIAVDEVAAWCPSCFIDGKPAPIVEGLDTYLSLLRLAYTAPPLAPGQTVATAASHRPIAGSGYLGTVIPESPRLESILRTAFLEQYQRGTDLLVARRYPDAIDELRAALRWNPDSAEAHNNLGIALASIGHMEEALDEFRQALAIDPGFADARRNLTTATTR